MAVTLGVRPGDDGTIVAVSGEVDVCTETPLQQALLRIMREHGARLCSTCRPLLRETP
jgi:anti-anti-sigma regulatory factor